MIQLRQIPKSNLAAGPLHASVNRTLPAGPTLSHAWADRASVTISPAARTSSKLVRHDPQQVKQPRESGLSRTLQRQSTGSSKGNGLNGQPQGIFWLGILWRPEQLTAIPAPSKRAQQILELNPKVQEIFGPFESTNLISAKLKLRAILVAVGFRVPATFK